MVIGHELTHGFDDQGRQYDGNGNALPWWSPDTVEAFTGQAQCFIDQYNNYTIDEIVDIVGADNAHVIVYIFLSCFVYNFFAPFFFQKLRIFLILGEW